MGDLYTGFFFLVLALGRRKKSERLFFSYVLFCLLLFFLSSSLDNRKLFRFMSIAGKGAGNSLIKTLQALSFCHVILGCK